MFTLDECPLYRRVKANVFWTTGGKLREFVAILIKVVVVVVLIDVLHFLTFYFSFFSPVELNPYAAHVYFNRANLYASLRKYKESEEDYTRGNMNTEYHDCAPEFYSCHTRPFFAFLWRRHQLEAWGNKIHSNKYLYFQLPIMHFCPSPSPPPPRPKKIHKLLFSNAPTAYSQAHLKTVVFAKLGVYRAERGYCSLPSRRFNGSRISFLATGGRKITLT